MHYSIQEVSSRTGLSAHTLRYYEKEGILTNIHRTAGGIRYYTDADMETPSMRRYTEAPNWGSGNMPLVWKLYFGDQNPEVFEEEGIFTVWVEIQE